MDISYDYYRVFYHAAKHRSITQAATALQNNQPNITRIIKKLENELGCVLFVRSRQGVTLTPEGEKLFEHIRIAFEHIEAAQEELALDKTLQKGTVSIATTDIALRCLLLPILKEYRKKYPGIRIRISSYSAPQAISDLKNGLVDIAVVTTPVDVPRTMRSTVVNTYQDVVVCGESFSYLKSKEISLSEIAELPIVCLGEHSKTYEFYSDLFSKQGIVFSPSVEATAADQILSLVKSDLGIGFIPENFLDNVIEDDSVFVLNLKERIPKRSTCVVKRKDFFLSAAARKLEEMILERKMSNGIKEEGVV